MYLSRVELNEYRRETMRAMDSPQVMHAAVMASFGSFGEGSGQRVLWRIDRLGCAVYLLVQSAARPDFTHIVEQFGRPATGQGWDTVEYDGHIGKMVDGSVWRFRLRANPVHSVKGDADRGKVRGHVTAEQQLSWLKERAGKLGFAVESDDGTLGVQIVQREVKKFNRQGKTVTLTVVTYEGVLRITDSALFADAMRNGIGRGKAYGCGLITTMGLRCTARRSRSCRSYLASGTGCPSSTWSTAGSAARTAP